MFFQLSADKRLIGAALTHFAADMPGYKCVHDYFVEICRLKNDSLDEGEILFESLVI